MNTNLLHLKAIRVEELVQLFVCVVDAKLFKAGRKVNGKSYF